MHYETIERRSWKNFLEHVSQVNRGGMMELEIAGERVGNQIEEKWACFECASYDGASDVIFLRTPSSGHIIADPREMCAGREGLFMRSISIRDADGCLQIINFRAPLLLDAPAAETRH